MPLFNNTASELIERTARILGDWKGGTCTSGGASTFVDTARTEADDYFQNTVPVSRVRIYATTDGAAPIGQERSITDWVNSTGTGTVSAAWTTANPAAGDKYAIMTEYSWDEIFHAINDTFDAVKNKSVIEKSDETTLVISDVLEYPVPSGFTHIYKISQSNDDGSFPSAIDPSQYIIIRSLSTPRIHFWSDANLSAGKTLRIEGFGYQVLLVNDVDLCYLDPMYVTYQAAAYLHARRVTRIDTEPTGHQAQFRMCQDFADGVKTKVFTQFPPDIKRVL